LLQLIDSPAGIAVEDAARTLDCAVRTIWRDLRVLEQAGFPLYGDKDSDGRRSIWKLQEDYKLGLPVKLTLAETAALLMSRDLLRPAGAEALGAVVTAAFDKIGRVLSREARQLLDQMRESIGVRAMSRDEENRRQVDPYHLTVFDGGFYLVGYCHWRKTERIFAVERVRELKVLAVRFEVRSGFRAEEYLKHAWGIIMGEIVPVKVVFSRSVSRYIRERMWHPSQKLRQLPDGRLELTLRVADTLEVRRWILGYGVQAELIEPPSLREALRGEAESLAAHLAPHRPPLAVSRLTRTGQRRARSG
jgi:predicted DNA-binding transcriptional regulator YafY